jgi:hypothetical protein
MHCWHFRPGRKVIGFWLPANDEKSVYSLDACFGGVVDLGIGHPPLMKGGKTSLGLLTKIVETPKLYRFCGTGLGTGRHQSDFLTVGTEGTFEGASVVLIFLDDAEGTGDHAIGAAVADIRLKIDSAKFGSYERASGARFETAGNLAVLADIGGELPRDLLGRVAADTGSDLIFNELDVTPGGVAESGGVVIGKAREVKAVRIDFVPLLAGHFTCLATDTKCRVREECRYFAWLYAGTVGGSAHGLASSKL